MSTKAWHKTLFTFQIQLHRLHPLVHKMAGQRRLVLTIPFSFLKAIKHLKQSPFSAIPLLQHRLGLGPNGLLDEDQPPVIKGKPLDADSHRKLAAFLRAAVADPSAAARCRTQTFAHGKVYSDVVQALIGRTIYQQMVDIVYDHHASYHQQEELSKSSGDSVRAFHPLQASWVLG